MYTTYCAYQFFFDLPRSKEEEGPKVYELQNIDKTIFDDETSSSSTIEKVDQVTHDIQKATTVETRAIYLCRRGALLRKVIPYVIVYYC